ncbi:MAG: class II fumarate hydratase [Spongiibacteraceae bacterium]
MPKTRIEHDSLGNIEVEQDRLWGAQTQRAITHFAISHERMPIEIVRALAMVKRAAAVVNRDLGLLPSATGSAIINAADEVLHGDLDDHFPLLVWQTGSGTQSNMNMNEVLANRATQLLGVKLEEKRIVHPNDHVNLGQSSNDVFPTAIHVAATIAISENLLPSLARLHSTLTEKANAFAKVIKIGRTHLQDATPLTLGQEISGWTAQLHFSQNLIAERLHGLYALAIGGTAVGTGLNTHPEFGVRVAAELKHRTALQFIVAPNLFSALAAHDAIIAVHGALRTLATALMKIANDIRWLASGPRCGIGELILPENEPGSSIMPGKINPTQCEAMTMLCAQVMGNDVTIGISGASGNFELNVFKPVIAHNLLQSIRLLADGMTAFEKYCVSELQANTVRIAEFLERSLMLVTALTPHIGYDRAAEIARRAHLANTTLREAALASGDITADDFDRWMNPQHMINTQNK